MVYTFCTPWDRDATCNVIKATVESMRGKAKVVSPGCIKAKWRTQSYHSKRYHTVLPSKFTFFVGDGVVRVVNGKGTMQMLEMGPFKVAGYAAIWNAFIESLLKTAPGVDFGIRPGDSELVEVQFFGDGIEEVFVSTTRHSPSLGGAVLGGMLFGTAGAIIGSSAGTSYTTGKSSTRFSNEVLARGRYSDGLIAEAVISKNSHLYNEIMVNMSRLSGKVER
jgi:hypothetical protein